MFDDAQCLHWLQRALFFPILVQGDLPPPILFLSYRRRLFGKHFAAFLHQSMRHCTEWSKAEVELFASFTASQLQCEF